MDVDEFSAKFNVVSVINVLRDCAVNTDGHWIYFRDDDDVVERVDNHFKKLGLLESNTICENYFKFLGIQGGQAAFSKFVNSLVCLKGKFEGNACLVVSEDKLDHIKEESRATVSRIIHEYRAAQGESWQPSAADAAASQKIDDAVKPLIGSIQALEERVKRQEDAILHAEDAVRHKKGDKDWKKILDQLHADQLALFDKSTKALKSAKLTLKREQRKLIKVLLENISGDLKDGCKLEIHAATGKARGNFWALEQDAYICRHKVTDYYAFKVLKKATIIIYVTLTRPSGSCKVVAFMAVDDQLPEEALAEGFKGSCYIAVACAGNTGLVGLGALMLQQLFYECIDRGWRDVHLDAVPASRKNWSRLHFEQVVNPCHNPAPVQIETDFLSRCVYSPSLKPDRERDIVRR